MVEFGRMPVLTTERLVIRPFTMDDLPIAHQLLDVELDWSGTLDERAEWLRFCVRLADKSPNPPIGYRAIALKGGGEVIGKCGYSAFILSADERNLFARSVIDAPTCNAVVCGFGYGLFHRFRGNGYATEAVRALIAHGFATLDLDALWSRTTADNTDSRRLMERVGMITAANPDAQAWPGIVGIIRNPRLARS